ncbi:MAG: F0F1 ATP synthase subunit A [Mycobacterium sp.]|nr:F0F1 ATP synthase subunit A [Mycobacterium sp.]
MMETVRYSAADVEVGNHFMRWGLNLDTIWSTLIAGAIVLIFGLLIARRATAGVPTGPQLAWETLVSTIEDQVEGGLGMKTAPFVVPLAIALFAFILIANWLEIIPAHGALPSPTGDINLPLALATVVIIWVHVWGSRRRGAWNYWKHFFSPLTLIEELPKPVTLTLRLFGNLFAGALMIELIGLFPAYVSWAPNVIWKLFDMFIGAMQAFIFALLTIQYFSGARDMADGGH